MACCLTRASASLTAVPVSYGDYDRSVSELTLKAKFVAFCTNKHRTTRNADMNDVCVLQSFPRIIVVCYGNKQLSLALSISYQQRSWPFYRAMQRMLSVCPLSSPPTRVLRQNGYTHYQAVNTEW